MSLTIFAAAGFVFIVQNNDGRVAQLTTIEALIEASAAKVQASNALIDFVMSEDNELLLVADEFSEIAEALETAALESLLA